MNSFIYEVPTKVYFGPNQRDRLAGELQRFGERVLLCYGGGSIKRNGLYQEITENLQQAGLTFYELSGIEPNPRLASVEEGVRICKEKDVQVILAVGGGSVIDCAKAISGAACYDGDPWDLISMKVPTGKTLPIVTVLTLAATGSEMDGCSVISKPETREKVDYFGPFVPRVSFLDPELTFSVSRYQTACGAADILSHVLEVYFNMEPDLALLDREMEGIMKTVLQFAPVALEKPEDYEARANLMWASTWAINGFVNGGKRQAWSCHPIEYEFSAFYDVAHGAGLAVLTPRWMEYVLDEETASRFYTYGINVFGIDPTLEKMEVAKKSIEKTAEFLFDILGLPKNLSELGVKEEDLTLMAKKAASRGVIKGFKPLGEEDILEIYRMCR